MTVDDDVSVLLNDIICAISGIGKLIAICIKFANSNFKDDALKPRILKLDDNLYCFQ